MLSLPCALVPDHLYREVAYHNRLVLRLELRVE